MKYNLPMKRVKEGWKEEVRKLEKWIRNYAVQHNFALNALIFELAYVPI